MPDKITMSEAQQRVDDIWRAFDRSPVGNRTQTEICRLAGFPPDVIYQANRYGLELPQFETRRRSGLKKAESMFGEDVELNHLDTVVALQEQVEFYRQEYKELKAKYLSLVMSI